MTSARVKSLLHARVEWLRGVPLAVETGAVTWLLLPPGEGVLRVDRSRLHETTRAVNELRRDYREALERIVGDVDLWRKRVLAAVARIKPSVHDGAPFGGAIDELIASLPRSIGQRVRARLEDPGTRSLVEALSWGYAFEPKLLGAALDALDEHAPIFAALMARAPQDQARLACFAALRIVRDDGARARALWSFLEETIEADVRTCEPEPFEKLFPVSIGAGAGPLPVRDAKGPTYPVLDALSGFLVWLGRLEAKTRRDALSLFAASAPSGLVARWGSAHRELEEIEREVRKRTTWHPNVAPIKRLRALRARLPPAWDPVEHLADLRALVATEVSIGKTLVPLLDVARRVLPEAPTRGAHLLSHWTSLVDRREDVQGRRLTMLLDALRIYLQESTQDSTDEPRERLAAWGSVLFDFGPRRGWTPDYDLLALRTPAHFRRAFEALRLVRSPRAQALVVTVADVVQLVPMPSAEHAAALCDALTERPEPSTASARQIAYELGPENADEFAKLACALAATATEALTDAWGKPGALARLDTHTRALLRRTIVETPSLVERWSHTVALAGAASLGLPQLAAPHARGLPVWAARYPHALHGALALLAAADADADEVAARILAEDFPRADVLTREISALEIRIAAAPGASAFLSKRLASLHARVTAPRTLSERRLANLAVKLDHAATRAYRQEWAARIDAACARAVAKLFAGEPPAWAMADVGLAIIAAASKLESAHRELALRVLRIRAGPPPWDLRDAPENVAVLRMLEARGIDPRPWVDGIGVVAEKGVDGAPIFLSLEDDPLEIFQMGERFGSCLSIGQCNFFSVFANAADIDKRVIYARDAKGMVLARRLVALDEDGRLLSFNTYAHVSPDAFEKLFVRFVSVLAERMGAVCAARGKVRPRVARDWYDDGPRDIGIQFSCLEDGSAYRRGLGTLRVEDMRATSVAAFAPRPLDGLTLPFVFALPEVRTRPELAVPLIAALTERASISETLRVASAVLAHRAGDLALARSVAGQSLVAEIESALTSQPDHVRGDLVEVQLDIDPRSLLAMTRRTAREHDRGSYGDEARLFIAARALERLGRPRRALTVLQTLRILGHRDIRGSIARLQAVLAKGHRSRTSPRARR